LQINQTGAKAGITVDIESGVSTIASYVIYIVTVVLFLDQLKIRTMVIYGTVGGLLLLFLLSFAIGVRNVFPNFRGRLRIKRNPKIKVGKKVNVNGIVGTIEKIRIQETILKTEQGDLLRVPNSLWNEKKINDK
ncbi:MAG: mechanosensitive ion channel domain-containing protein, partial [Nanoarchaeota archaeon]